jgi:hypothetical protein
MEDRMLRTHDVVVADGTFRIVVTPKRRVIAVLDAHETLLGPLHIALEIDREPHLPPGIPPHVLLEPSHVTSGVFDDIGHAVSRAAEGTFNTASKAATTVARPAFNVLKNAAGEGAHLIAKATPLLPSGARKQIDAAAHVVMRARMGDVTAKQFMRTIGSAAKAGVGAARHVGDALLDAGKVVAKAVDVPVMLAKNVPGLGDVVRSISPLESFQKMTGAIQKGDFKEIKRIAEQDLSMAQGVVSLIPGLGTGISSAIGAGLAALEGGNPLEVAIRTAYGAIPIPVGLRQVTDMVLDSVLALLAHPHDLTEAGIQIAREHVPAGVPRDVFDTLVQLVVRHVPVQKAASSLVEHYAQPVGQAASSLVDHYVQQYAPALGDMHVDDALKHLHQDPAGRMVQPLHLHHT